MPKGKIYNREDMGEWIKDVRERSGQSAASFAAFHIRFQEKENQLKAVGYTRSAISYWENGNHLPSYVETILSIALQDYDLTHQEQLQALHTDLSALSGRDLLKAKAQQERYRGERFQYVLNAISRYLGRGLYCKNFVDLLLLYAARGILTVQEIPEVYNKLIAIILEEQIGKSIEEKKVDSALRNTMALFDDLMGCASVEALFENVKKNASTYAIGYRVVGDRLEQLYQRNYSHKYGNLDLASAVRFFAPSYKDSVKKLMSYELLVSRMWIIRLGVLLHFTREDINQVLSYAQYNPLSEEPGHIEAMIQEREEGDIGTIPWFGAIEREYLARVGMVQQEDTDSDFSPVRFGRLKELSARERLVYVLQIGLMLFQEQEELPIPSDLLDYLPSKSDFKKKAEKAAEHGGEQVVAAFHEDVKNLFFHKNEVRAYSNELDGFMEAYKKERGKKLAHPGRYHYGNEMNELQFDVRDEYMDYFELPEYRLKALMQDLEALTAQQKTQLYTELELCRYFTGLCYTVFTGFIYKGTLSQGELEHMGACEADQKLFGALRFLFRLFLGNEPIHLGAHGGFALSREDVREYHFARILVQLGSYL